MGKKRIKIVGEEKALKEKKSAATEGRKLVKTGKEHGRITDMGAEALAEAERIKEKEKELTEKATEEKKGKKKAPQEARKRGKRYLDARQKIDRNKLYPLPEAIKLLKDTSISKFNGSVDVHLNVKEAGLKGEVGFPHPAGKSQKMRIADEKLIKELEKGKIDFDLLLTTPAMMPKLAKFAKLLGPKGLMPNPKAGTITEKPEELAKKLEGKSRFRTETKSPLIHQVIGKVDSKETELKANFLALIEAVGRRNIEKAVLTSTMGPGIKIDLDSLS